MTASSQVAALLPTLKDASTAVVVVDSTVDSLYGDAFVRELEATGLRIERLVFPAGEPSKTVETYARLVRGLAALELTRTDVLIALGGGVTGDLTGFAAATYLRGVRYIQVPTTLLAMVDSSIGGKTGVDLPEGKNLLGAFHLPEAVVRDPAFLQTLSAREIRNGLAEMIKTAVLFDPVLFAELKSAAPDFKIADHPDWIERCAGWKQKIVDADFREGEQRKLLNLGHTFGHAIEQASDYRFGHGEAVAMGMRFVSKDVPEIGEILDAFGYPTFVPAEEPEVFARARDFLLTDKKRHGDRITLVVPRAVGRCELVDIPIAELGRWFA